MGVELAVGLATTAISAGLGAWQSAEANAAAEQANKLNEEMQRRRIEAETGQARVAERDLQSKLARQFDIYVGRAATTNEARGVGTSVTSADIIRSLTLGTARESAAASINLAFQEQAILASYNPQYTPGTSPIIAAIGGGLQGLGLGLDIGSGMAKLGAAEEGLSHANAMTGIYNKGTTPTAFSGLSLTNAATWGPF